MFVPADIVNNVHYNITSTRTQLDTRHMVTHTMGHLTKDGTS